MKVAVKGVNAHCDVAHKSGLWWRHRITSSEVAAVSFDWHLANGTAVH